MASLSSDEKKKQAKRFLEAASSGNLPLLKEVAKALNKGNGLADAIKEIKDANGDSAFHLAAYHGRTEICHYFLQDLGFPVDFLTAKGETPFFHAAMGGQVATARYLISHGANHVVSDRNGMTPLHCAAKYGHGKLVKYLISLGVPVDITVNYATGAPLIVAAQFGQASAMEVLLEHHADANGATSADFTPLFLSIFGGSLECTKLLIKAGADVNLKCPLLMAASHKGSIEIVKCLLEAGADPNVRNEYGWLPVERAAMDGKLDIVEMLFPLTTPVPEVPCWSVHGLLQYVNTDAFEDKNKEILRKLLEDLKVKGANSFKKAEYLAAICFYNKAIEIDSGMGSGDAALFSNRSLCWLRVGEGYCALKDAIMAQTLRPEWPKAYYRIGAAMMLLEDYEPASQAFMDGLRLDPTNIEIKNAHREAVDCLRKSRSGEASE
ncbi:ankyrin repeat family protein [Rhynchospora pubera]|uniref:Ankyrin repeat family protein n=1 Tax=Rhynchospora pubera TaxID=906938 RepID=A0AAV8F8V7_9POAL|nr:ankyrin repeat family protein [Rhynchospora pubera]